MTGQRPQLAVASSSLFSPLPLLACTRGKAGAQGCRPRWRRECRRARTPLNAGNGLPVPGGRRARRMGGGRRACRCGAGPGRSLRTYPAGSSKRGALQHHEPSAQRIAATRPHQRPPTTHGAGRVAAGAAPSGSPGARRGRIGDVIVAAKAAWHAPRIRPAPGPTRRRHPVYPRGGEGATPLSNGVSHRPKGGRTPPVTRRVKPHRGTDG